MPTSPGYQGIPSAHLDGEDFHLHTTGEDERHLAQNVFDKLGLVLQQQRDQRSALFDASTLAQGSAVRTRTSPSLHRPHPSPYPSPHCPRGAT